MTPEALLWSLCCLDFVQASIPFQVLNSLTSRRHGTVQHTAGRWQSKKGTLLSPSPIAAKPGEAAGSGGELIVGVGVPQADGRHATVRWPPLVLPRSPACGRDLRALERRETPGSAQSLSCS